ncbi:hypothetical protein IGI04_037641 [Brassica rapa subsp. trilocularis]|uniref:Uncharacterized protein n=1 Tax=Brassica rapa subsp. trilocularis TaxID=1813537 RepID=A0ABQ7LKA1_BRACM|nr:hypothetical protein IGI04_037641 [Brassica rapa subsp. trilocularis]
MNAGNRKNDEASVFRMPLHYPRYSKRRLPRHARVETGHNFIRLRFARVETGQNFIRLHRQVRLCYKSFPLDFNSQCKALSRQVIASSLKKYIK